MNFDLKKEYYKILGLKNYSSKKDVKKAYRNLSKKLHPDISNETNSLEEFKQISEAYKFLNNNELKKVYDIYLKLLEENPLIAETFVDMEFNAEMMLDMARTMMPEISDELDEIENNSESENRDVEDTSQKLLSTPFGVPYYSKEIATTFLDRELQVMVPSNVFKNGLTVNLEQNIELRISLTLLEKVREGYKIVFNNAGYKQNQKQGRLILTLEEVA